MTTEKWKALGAAVAWVTAYGLITLAIVHLADLPREYAAVILPGLTLIKQAIGSQLGDPTNNAIPVPFVNEPAPGQP